LEEDRHALVTYDLRFDPKPFLDMSEDELRDLLFSERQEDEQARPPLNMVRLNSCPYLAPLTVLDRQARARLGIDFTECRENLHTLEVNPDLKARFIAAYRFERKSVDEFDPEHALYAGGFYSDEDRRELERFHRVLKASGPLAAKNEFFRIQFQDPRIPTLMGRLLARNFSETLTEDQHLSWKKHVSGWLQLPQEKGAAALADYVRLEKELQEMSPDDPRKPIAAALIRWKDRLSRQAI